MRQPAHSSPRDRAERIQYPTDEIQGMTGQIHMAEYKHGEMDITEQTKTFDGFMKFVTYAVAVIVVLIVLMAIFIT
jgi:hypothetical protein